MEGSRSYSRCGSEMSKVIEVPSHSRVPLESGKLEIR